RLATLAVVGRRRATAALIPGQVSDGPVPGGPVPGGPVPGGPIPDGAPGTPSDLRLPAQWRVKRVDMPPLDISSSDLRDRHRRGLPLDYLVPDPVIDLIRQRGLYAGGTMTTGSGGR
ncbi:MAG TPA: hypothetical protein VM942_00410, partial [Acidimicrobiales bacterium]|nr:hypothetical protein [Acidimicrobiales bacterium]